MKQEEVFCNAVTGEPLVLANELYEFIHNLDDKMRIISILANKFSVSKDVIVRRLYDTGIINHYQYENYYGILRAKLDESKLFKIFINNSGILPLDSFQYAVI